MARVTYAEVENIIKRELYNKLQQLKEEHSDLDDKLHTVAYQLASYHEVELSNKPLFDIYQKWHDNTHLCKRTVFCIPKSRGKEIVEQYMNGNAKELNHMMNVLLEYAIKL